MTPSIAVCMTTYEPPLDLLDAQLRSIREQTWSDFVCIVSDDGSAPSVARAVERACSGDKRFRFVGHRDNVGYYRNFERCLELVPPDVRFVALSDQDDVWHADKLETLVSELRVERVQLAYADMAIVSTGGELLAPSYWTDRANNHTDLASLLLINTVTGAASVFRRELLDVALPFPDVPGKPFHDHWLACIALALGDVAFIDRPLHDYVQHGDNVVGRHEPLPAELRGGLLNAFGRFVRDPRRRLRNTIGWAQRYYEDEVVVREAFAQALRERLNGRLDRAAASAVDRVADMSSSSRSLLWLLGRSARDVRGDSPTLGIENQLIKGILWHRLHRRPAPVSALGP
jgi:glycosyltransferase involved in cell wall biosynthesis